MVKTTSCIFFVFFLNLFDFLRFDTSIHYFWDPFGLSMKVEYGTHYRSSTLGRFCVHYYWPEILDFRIQPTLQLSGGLAAHADAAERDGQLRLRFCVLSSVLARDQHRWPRPGLPHPNRRRDPVRVQQSFDFHFRCADKGDAQTMDINHVKLRRAANCAASSEGPQGSSRRPDTTAHAKHARAARTQENTRQPARTVPAAHRVFC